MDKEVFNLAKGLGEEGTKDVLAHWAWAISHLPFQGNKQAWAEVEEVLCAAQEVIANG